MNGPRDAIVPPGRSVHRFTFAAAATVDGAGRSGYLRTLRSQLLRILRSQLLRILRRSRL